MNDEFILTNRAGGYVSFDLTLGHTRKYHGLLIAGLENVNRRVVLASVNEEVEIDSQIINFSGNYYLNLKQPALTSYLHKAFFLPSPTQVFKVGSLRIHKIISLDETSENCLELTYLVSTPVVAKIRVEPLLTMRDFHDVGLSLTGVSLKLAHKEQIITLAKNASLQVISTAEFREEQSLSTDHYYPVEEERGYEAHEDLLKVGRYEQILLPGTNKIKFVVSLQSKPLVRRLFTVAQDIISPSDNISIATDISRFHQLHPEIDKNLSEYLVYNARKFIIKDEQRYSLIAGYHWFGEWSRDTFIAFKGIMLGLGRYHEAQRILLDWGKYIAVGLLPNQMQGMHFNSLDGILWYINAVHEYWLETKDKDTVLHLLPKLERAIYALARGTKYGIGVNDLGFLIWTDETKALTWMDAIVDEHPVTQRVGAAVEIQALWYNALQTVEVMAQKTNYRLINLPLIDQLEKLLEGNFHSHFWISSHNYYADFISNGGSVNSELRPNQLALYSLPYRLGNADVDEKVLEKVEKELLTPVGLRTLAPNSQQYKPNYFGNQRERDLAYHQGIIWPWLLKLYYGAVMNITGDEAEAKAKIKKHLESVWEELKQTNISTVPELFSNDGLTPGGALNQAWSVAALIEAIMYISEK